MHVSPAFDGIKYPAKTGLFFTKAFGLFNITAAPLSRAYFPARHDTLNTRRIVPETTNEFFSPKVPYRARIRNPPTPMRLAFEFNVPFGARHRQIPGAGRCQFGRRRCSTKTRAPGELGVGCRRRAARRQIVAATGEVLFASSDRRMMRAHTRTQRLRGGDLRMRLDARGALVTLRDRIS